MKSKILGIFIIIFFGSISVMAQDTSENQRLSENQTYHVNTPQRNYKNSPQHHIYRDTRLGGSSPLYNTYKKNDYGAGAITTNPNKTGSINFLQQNSFDTTKNQNQIYRDTRLGGSSPNDRTYKTNDNGAGAITTNPHK